MELGPISGKAAQAQNFIQTPQCNTAILEASLKALSPATRVGVAYDLTLPTEWICVQTVAQWKQQPRPDFQKRPAVFLVDAEKR